MEWSWCRVDAHDRVCTWGLWRFTTKPLSYLVDPQIQDRRLCRRRRDPGVPRCFDVGGHVVRSYGLLREDPDYSNDVVM
jgi:hypothetical protein